MPQDSFFKKVGANDETADGSKTAIKKEAAFERKKKKKNTPQGLEMK